MAKKEEEKKQYTIRFPPEAVDALEDMAKEEGVTKAELVRRAINFYQVKLEAKKGKKKIILESEEEPKREWVMV
ncbi:ribbon-helix-helix protein, CopG family [candidate division NPL-UPA2 bacterium]|nr:ribbon-helix-helix protein, CopG family [candidate division NPL-UPA2 bacterium]